MSENFSQNSIIETQNNGDSPSISDSENEHFHDTVSILESEEELEMAAPNLNIELPPFYDT